MMRESSVDKYNERTASSVIEKLWDVKLFECSKGYRCDWQIMRKGKHLAFGEYKCSRKPIKSKGDNYWIDFSKILWLESAVLSTGKPVFLFIEFDEGIFYYEINVASPRLETGRFSMRDTAGEANKKPCSHIPIKSLIKLSENEASPV